MVSDVPAPRLSAEPPFATSVQSKVRGGPQKPNVTPGSSVKVLSEPPENVFTFWAMGFM